MVKDVRLGKFVSRAHIPYTIVGFTPNNNVFLKTEEGKRFTKHADKWLVIHCQGQKPENYHCMLRDALKSKIRLMELQDMLISDKFILQTWNIWHSGYYCVCFLSLNNSQKDEVSSYYLLIKHGSVLRIPGRDEVCRWELANSNLSGCEQIT